MLGWLLGPLAGKFPVSSRIKTELNCWFSIQALLLLSLRMKTSNTLQGGYATHFLTLALDVGVELLLVIWTAVTDDVLHNYTMYRRRARLVSHWTSFCSRL